ncbi:hypothetical protein GCM10023100_70680 [Actinocorallia cavernae]|uniref:Uncharacterized protein n=2 Tax=Actinomycetes TaxID=1760 RepID=A0ABP8TA68_9ACTN
MLGTRPDRSLDIQHHRSKRPWPSLVPLFRVRDISHRTCLNYPVKSSHGSQTLGMANQLGQTLAAHPGPELTDSPQQGLRVHRTAISQQLGQPVNHRIRHPASP